MTATIAVTMPIGNSDGLNILLAISSETIKKIAPISAAIGTKLLHYIHPSFCIDVE